MCNGKCVSLPRISLSQLNVEEFFFFCVFFKGYEGKGPVESTGVSWAHSASARAGGTNGHSVCGVIAVRFELAAVQLLAFQISGVPRVWPVEARGTPASSAGEGALSHDLGPVLGVSTIGDQSRAGQHLASEAVNEAARGRVHAGPGVHIGRCGGGHRAGLGGGRRCGEGHLRCGEGHWRCGESRWRCTHDATGRDDHRRGRGSTRKFVKSVNNIHPRSDAAKNDVETIKPRGGLCRDKKLGPICVGSGVCHCEGSRLKKIKREACGFVIEFVAINRTTTSAIASGEVSALNHEVGDNAMELGARIPVAILVGGQSFEICHCEGHSCAKKSQFDSSSWLSTNTHVKVDRACDGLQGWVVASNRKNTQ